MSNVCCKRWQSPLDVGDKLDQFTWKLLWILEYTFGAPSQGVILK